MHTSAALTRSDAAPEKEAASPLTLRISPHLPISPHISPRTRPSPLTLRLHRLRSPLRLGVAFFGNTMRHTCHGYDEGAQMWFSTDETCDPACVYDVDTMEVRPPRCRLLRHLGCCRRLRHLGCCSLLRHLGCCHHLRCVSPRRLISQQLLVLRVLRCLARHLPAFLPSCSSTFLALLLLFLPCFPAPLLALLFCSSSCLALLLLFLPCSSAPL